MNRFSIKDLETLTGIKAHTIRIWEQRYGLLQPKRTATNIRYYDGSDLKHALRISLLNQYGYKISRIGQMTEEEMDTLILKITDAGFKLQALVHTMLEQALLMDVNGLESLLNEHIRRNGVEKAVEGLVFSFLEKVGSMWMSNKLVPAQEHLASNIIVRKIAVAIDGLPLPLSSGPATLLFLPEGEIHELGLHYMHYLLRKAGRKVFYLGANTPMSEAAAAAAVHHPEHAFVHLTAASSGQDLQRKLKNLSAALPEVTIHVSGAQLREKNLPALPNIKYLFSLGAVRAAVEGNGAETKTPGPDGAP